MAFAFMVNAANPENRDGETHWTFNIYTQYNMTLTGVVNLDGESMVNNSRSAYLEVGAFCGEECRGSYRATLNPAPFAQGYYYQMQIYSDVQSGETITFRIWDHEADAELDVTCSSDITFVADDGLGNLMFPYELTFTSNGGPTFATISATAEPEEGGTVIGAGTYEIGTTCTLTATANDGYSFVNWTENDEVVSVENSYSFTVTGDRDLVANFVEIGGDDHAYVDLGLPSGLLWAACNVGANAPEEYGDYFAWGETQPKDVYNWSTYQYCMGSNNTLTKYCTDPNYGYNGFTDNLTILLPEDDAATANWGNGWRMPTKEEWQELLDNTTVTWTQQNGVNGRLFTGSNGNSLFLPAAGRWGG